MNTTRNHAHKPTARPRHIGANSLTTERQRWQAYEAAKHLWECQHPEASGDEHEQAMRAIAQRVGV